MTAVALATTKLAVPAELEQEILARIDRAGLQVCEAELRYTLRWDEHKDGSLLDLLDELERSGLIESALHFRLTEHGRARLPEGYQPPLRYGTGIPLAGALMNAGNAQSGRSRLAALADELQRCRASRPAEIARHPGPDWTEHQVLAALAELFAGGAVGHHHEVALRWAA